MKKMQHRLLYPARIALSVVLLCALAPACGAEPPVPIEEKTVREWSAPFRNWHYHPDHVIPAKPGIPGYEKIQVTDVPTVFQIPGDPKWYMSFIGFDGGGYQSFIAESDDLVNWTNHRLAMDYGPEGEFDHGGVVLGAYLYESYDIKAPRTLKKKDGKFWSLYGAYDKRTGYEAGVGSNGLAVSNDGRTWTKFQKEPVISIHDADRGGWENTMIYQPWLTEHEGTYYSHYNAKGGPEQTGVVTSKDLLKWIRYEKNPVIPVGATIYNTQFSADPKVFRDGDHWTCFFFGVGEGGAHIMAAYSRDLFRWTVDPEPIYKAGGNPSGLDKQYAHKISLVWNPKNKTYYMFYNAVGNKSRGIGLITSQPLAQDHQYKADAGDSMARASDVVAQDKNASPLVGQRDIDTGDKIPDEGYCDQPYVVIRTSEWPSSF